MVSEHDMNILAAKYPLVVMQVLVLNKPISIHLNALELVHAHAFVYHI